MKMLIMCSCQSLWYAVRDCTVQNLRRCQHGWKALHIHQYGLVTYNFYLIQKYFLHQMRFHMYVLFIGLIVFVSKTSDSVPK